jgi:hypothetical protein
MSEMPDGLPLAEGWEDSPSSATGITSMKKLLQFTESQTNIDRLAIRLGLCVAAFGTMVAIATIVAMFARCQVEGQ